MSKDGHVPFAITATTLGRPQLLYTKVLLANLDCEDKICAAYVNAMWDTGSPVSIMGKELASRLDFKFSREIKSMGITGDEMATFGYAYLSLVSNGGLIDTRAAIVERVPSPDYSFIIGMDLISKGSLAICSTGLSTTLSFTVPPVTPIDFIDHPESEGKEVERIPLSSDIEDKKVYRGYHALEIIAPQLKNLKK